VAPGAPSPQPSPRPLAFATIPGLVCSPGGKGQDLEAMERGFGVEMEPFDVGPRHSLPLSSRPRMGRHVRAAPGREDKGKPCHGDPLSPAIHLQGLRSIVLVCWPLPPLRRSAPSGEVPGTSGGQRLRHFGRAAAPGVPSPQPGFLWQERQKAWQEETQAATVADPERPALAPSPPAGSLDPGTPVLAAVNRLRRSLEA